MDVEEKDKKKGAGRQKTTGLEMLGFFIGGCSLIAPLWFPEALRSQIPVSLQLFLPLPLAISSHIRQH